MFSLRAGERQGTASLADLMGHESVETINSFYAILKQNDLRCKHSHYSAARWGVAEYGR